MGMTVAEFAKTAKNKTVTYIPPLNPVMQGKSKVELIEHGRKGEKQAIEAGLELLRREDNKSRRKLSA